MSEPKKGPAAEPNDGAVTEKMAEESPAIIANDLEHIVGGAETGAGASSPELSCTLTYVY